MKRKLLPILWVMIAAVLLATSLPMGQERQERFYKQNRVTSWTKTLLPCGEVRVNFATEDELCALVGVGPNLAAVMAQERLNNGPFYYPEDILAVKGIGWGKLRKMLHQLDMSVDAREAQ